MNDYDWLDWFYREQLIEQHEAEAADFDELMKCAEEHGGES